MRNILKLVIVIAAMATLFGCISTKSYVDPQFRNATYDQIDKSREKRTVQIVVEFQRNGKHFAAADNELFGHVDRVVRASGAFNVTKDSSAPKLFVIANNIADMGSAAGKGFLTGLTFGAAGNVVSDFYEFNISLDKADGSKLERAMKHAIHTTVGNKAAPVAATATTPAAAFGQVVEDLILGFVKDAQNENVAQLFNVDRDYIWAAKVASK